jgi:hypothetical protein
LSLLLFHAVLFLAPGTLFSMASMLNHRIPGFVDEKTKAFPNQVSSLLMLNCFQTCYNNPLFATACPASLQPVAPASTCSL